MNLTDWLLRPRTLDLDRAVIKFIVEIVLAIVLHPVAYILCVIDIVNRADMSGFWKVFWIIVTFPWGIGPILYLIFGGGKFW